MVTCGILLGGFESLAFPSLDMKQNWTRDIPYSLENTSKRGQIMSRYGSDVAYTKIVEQGRGSDQGLLQPGSDGMGGDPDPLTKAGQLT